MWIGQCDILLLLRHAVAEGETSEIKVDNQYFATASVASVRCETLLPVDVYSAFQSQKSFPCNLEPLEQDEPRFTNHTTNLRSAENLYRMLHKLTNTDQRSDEYSLVPWW